jgi:hypothetical protein
MIRVLHPNYENLNICECSPPQGLSDARRGRRFTDLVPDPPRGRPVGGGDVHRNRGHGGLNPHNYVGAIQFFVGFREIILTVSFPLPLPFGHPPKCESPHKVYVRFSGETGEMERGVEGMLSVGRLLHKGEKRGHPPSL